MKEIKNPEAYFAVMLENLDKNEFRSNDNYYKHISSVGDEADLEKSVSKDAPPPDANAVEHLICDADLENWLLLMDNLHLHSALLALPQKDVEFVFALSRHRYNCREYALANGLSKQAVSKQFRRLKKLIREKMEKGLSKMACDVSS